MKRLRRSVLATVGAHAQTLTYPSPRVAHRRALERDMTLPLVRQVAGRVPSMYGVVRDGGGEGPWIVPSRRTAAQGAKTYLAPRRTAPATSAR